MPLESGKRALLNAVVAIGGVLAGSWLGRSESIRSLTEKAAKTLSEGGGESSSSDHASTPGKKGPLRNFKEYIQKKEGFRQ